MLTPQKTVDAIDAALDAASLARLPSRDHVVLHRRTKVVIHLRPLPVVAKVVANGPARSRHERAQRELAIARDCAERSVPVAEPAVDIPRRVYRTARLPVTFWRHYELIAAQPDPQELAEALSALHRGLAGIPFRLPPLSEERGLSRALLADDQQLAALDPVRRAQLREATARLWAAMPQWHSESPLQGEPHAGNIFTRSEVSASATSSRAVSVRSNGTSRFFPTSASGTSTGLTSFCSGFERSSAHACPRFVGPSSRPAVTCRTTVGTPSITCG
jgi:hypothetical protein